MGRSGIHECQCLPLAYRAEVPTHGMPQGKRRLSIVYCVIGAAVPPVTEGSERKDAGNEKLCLCERLILLLLSKGERTTQDRS